MINNGEFLIPEPPGAKAEERLFYLVNRKRSYSLICRGCACRSSRGKTGSEVLPLINFSPAVGSDTMIHVFNSKWMNIFSHCQ